MAIMSDLPPELLGAIVRNLTEPTDLIRFRSVSSCWRSATSSLPIPPLRLPWLFLHFIPDELLCYFYSFSEDRIYKIHSPDGWESEDLFNLSSTGWFPASKEKTDDGKFTSLLNLFTGTAVDLPVPQVNPNFKQIFADDNYLWQNDDWLLARHYFLSVMKISTYPDNCLIISSLKRYAPMVRLDDFKLPFLSPMFYPLKEEHLHFLAVSSDKLYILVNVRCGPLLFMVYLMNQHAKKQEWICVSDIGDRAILYDQERCILVEAEAACSTRLKRNSVYFSYLKPCKRGDDDHGDWIYRMRRFDLSNGTCEEVSSQLDTFFVSNPWRQLLKSHSWIEPTFVENTN